MGTVWNRAFVLSTCKTLNDPGIACEYMDSMVLKTVVELF